MSDALARWRFWFWFHLAIVSVMARVMWCRAVGGDIRSVHYDATKQLQVMADALELAEHRLKQQQFHNGSSTQDERNH